MYSPQWRKQGWYLQQLLLSFHLPRQASPSRPRPGLGPLEHNIFFRWWYKPFARQTWSCRGEERLALSQFCSHPAPSEVGPPELEIGRHLRRSLTNLDDLSKCRTVHLLHLCSRCRSRGCQVKKEKQEERKRHCCRHPSFWWLTAPVEPFSSWWGFGENGGQGVVGTQGPRELRQCNAPWTTPIHSNCNPYKWHTHTKHEWWCFCLNFLFHSNLNWGQYQNSYNQNPYDHNRINFLYT